MSAALAVEARTMIQILRDAVALSDGANAKRMQMVIDLLVRMATELRDIDRLRKVEAAAMRVASSRRGGAVSDASALDLLDSALES